MFSVRSSLRATARVFATALFLVLSGARTISAQGTTGTGFVAGARTIVNLDFAAEPVGDVPKGLRPHFGKLDVVDKDGVHMLRASSPSDFVLHLPEALPKNFTIEFDLIPKACCNPVDLMVEGVISGSRSSVSAQIEWDAEHFAVVGGHRENEMFQMDMPAAIAAGLPSERTKVALSIEDETITMYTNGTRIYTLTNRRFVRRRLLHISLGGQDEDKYAVYLASVRVADLAPSIVASNAPQAGPRTASPMPTQPNVAPPPGAAANTLPDGFTVTVSPGANGPVASWSAVATASGYTVNRYKIDDTQCCTSSSGRGWLSGLSWQDTPLPVSGKYVYLVLAATPAGQLRGQATFDYVQSSPTVTPPIASSLVTVPSGFDVSVTMGPTAPLVSWTSLPNTMRYAVDRVKIGDSCCGSSSGRATITSPWQDAPLPMSGMYEYTVTAYTPTGLVFGQAQFGFRMPGGTAPSQPAPVTGVLTSPTGTATPMTAPVTGVVISPTMTTGTSAPMPGSPTIAPIATAPLSGTSPNNPAQSGVISWQPEYFGAPAKVRFSPVSPASVRVFWDLPTSAPSYVGIEYTVYRALAGTSNLTLLTPKPLMQTYVLDDVVPDPRQTYTYTVTAAFGVTAGSTSADYTPPAPVDPAGFTAQLVGQGEVLLTWDAVPGVSQFMVTGPGVGNGALTDGQPMTGGTPKHTYSVKGLPPGTHTWHLATSYQPGGVLTAPAAWSVASATLGMTTGKYAISVESIRSNNGAIDNILNVDGVGNEVLVVAEIDLVDKAGQVTQSARKTSVLYGDITPTAPPARVQAGSGRPNGGIGTGDLVSPIWEQPITPVQGAGFGRLMLWQGPLTDGETVNITPSIWEWDDGNEIASLPKWSDFMKRRAVPLDLSQRTNSGEISNVLREEPWYIKEISFGAWEIGHPGAMWANIQNGDRPIGVATHWPAEDPAVLGYSFFYPIAIQVTQSVAEAAIAGAYGAPGLISIRFVDHAIGSKSIKTIPEYGYGDYTLNLKIERIP